MTEKQKIIEAQSKMEWTKDKPKKYVQYGDIIDLFHDALAELDARYQGGVIAPPEEIDQLTEASIQITGYVESMKIDNKLREERNGAGK